MARESRVSTWSKLAAGGASALVVVVALGAHFEGQRLHAYRDVGGTPTICYGETHGVKPGQTSTPQECSAMLKARMALVKDRVDACIDKPMTAGQEAAFTDLAYNVGWPTFCRSSVARRFNAGDPAGACDSILRYDKAAGKVLPGLVARRRAERELCMHGVQ